MAPRLCCLSRSAQPLLVHPLTTFVYTWGVGGCQPMLSSLHANATISGSSPAYGRWQREERRAVSSTDTW